MTLRIATWNIFFGTNLASIFQIIKTHKDFLDIDVFAIQEASIHSNIEDAQRISHAFGKQYDYYQVTSHIFKGMVQANAVVWNTKRVKLTKKDVIDLPKNVLPVGQRKSLVIEGLFAKKSFRLYAAHFDVFGFKHRTTQLACILGDDKKRKQVDFSCILGDLNTFAIFKRPTWIRLKELAEKHRYIDITTHITWTFHRQSIGFRQKLDAILLRDADSMRYTCWSNDIAGSDHIPIFANIEL